MSGTVPGGRGRLSFASLGSGSKGNATLVESGDTRILLDCGFAAREAEKRLARLDRNPRALSAVVVTHEHSDHIRGVAAFARRHRLPVHLTFGTRKAVSDGRHSLDRVECHEVRPERPFQVGDVEVEPVPVPHDAREPCQYIFRAGERVLGVLTDLGSLTPHVVRAFGECDALVLECNHDTQLLAAGPYPPGLKRRVGGDLGHLNNAQAAQLLQHVNQDRLRHLVLCHLSEENNTPDHARRAIHQVLPVGHERVRVACQSAGFDWLEV